MCGSFAYCLGMVDPFTPSQPIDMLDRDFYAGDPYPTYAWMREHAPVYWDDARQLWAVMLYDDVLAIEKQPELFCNGLGYRPNTPADGSMISQDDPQHKAQKRYVMKGFTPKAVAAKEDHVRSIVTTLIDNVAPAGACDLVSQLAAPLPMILIAEYLGAPLEDCDTLQSWSDTVIGGADDPAYVTDEVATAHLAFVVYALELMEQRKAEPGADLLSLLVHEEIDGERLSEDAIVSEALLLLVGGNETTRNVISGGLEALIRNPEQRQRLLDDPSLIPVAVEECLRWVTPILSFRRTATADVEMRGQTIRAGDQVLNMYASANRDPAVFADPEHFDVGRNPNPHLAFGFGPHFCLGAQLARLELRVMLEEVLRRLPDLRLADDAPVARSHSSFIRGVHHMPVEFTPTT